MEIAALEGADAVSHGATGKGNDQVRFELSYLAIDPHIQIIAPWREWDLNSRTALMDFAEKHGIPVPTTQAKPYSTDRNLLHISYEGGILEDPWQEPPEDMFTLTVSPRQAPDEPGDHRDRLSQRGTRWPSTAAACRRPTCWRSSTAWGAARHRAGRPGGKPVCGDEIPRCLRNPRAAPFCAPPTWPWNRSPWTARSCICAIR